MNIVSTMVGLSIAGIAAPANGRDEHCSVILLLRKRSILTQAESQAVAVAGTAEADQALPTIPAGCSVSPPVNTVYTVSCTSGSGTRFSTTVARSFRIIPQLEDGGSGGRTFQFDTPTQFSSHQCPQTDQWGVSYGYNDTWSDSLGGCLHPSCYLERK